MLKSAKKITYWILSLQELVLRKKLKKSLKSSFSNSTSKTVFRKSDSLNFTMQTDKNKEKLKSDVETILKKYENNPQKLLEFIEKKGTLVNKIPFADKVLKVIGYEEGFIGALKGTKALYLSTAVAILGKSGTISLKTEPMFVLRDLPVNNYYMIQQFHKWYGMKLNLPGFDEESQANFQKFLNSSDDSDIKELNIDEILGLKEAIARDVEAIDFVVRMARAGEGSRNALKMISAESGASV